MHRDGNAAERCATFKGCISYHTEHDDGTWNLYRINGIRNYYDFFGRPETKEAFRDICYNYCKNKWNCKEFLYEWKDKLKYECYLYNSVISTSFD